MQNYFELAKTKIQSSSILSCISKSFAKFIEKSIKLLLHKEFIG